MATIVRTQNFITVSGIAADVTPSDIFKDSQEKLIKRIEFKPGAGGDTCVVKQETDTGATITILAGVAAFNVDRVSFGDVGQYMKPYIDFSAGVFSANHSLTIELA